MSGMPDKTKAFSEIYRTLKPGGHFCISDIVTNGALPQELKRSAELYAGCVTGAIEEETYLDIIREQGFNRVEIKLKKEIKLPDSVLREYLSDSDRAEFQKNGTGIYSITVIAKKYYDSRAENIFRFIWSNFGYPIG